MLAPSAATAFLTSAQLASASPSAGRLLVAGYASLMDEASARETMPSVSAFRLGVVPGYCRVFNLVSIINVRRGLATGRRLATCTARPRPGCSLSVCVFEIPLAELEPLAVREARLRLAPVRVEALGGDDAAAAAALLCLESSDDEYRERWCGDDADAYHEQCGQHYDGRLYRDDCLPVPSYLLRCMRAHAAAGTLPNFLDASFLGDGRTTLRAHVLAEVDAPECGWSDEERREVRTICA